MVHFSLIAILDFLYQAKTVHFRKANKKHLEIKKMFSILKSFTLYKTQLFSLYLFKL